MCNCLSVFLAQLIGLYLFLICLSMLLHQQRFKKIMTEFLGNQALLTLSGGVGIILGLLIVLSHNMWVSAWPVLITVVGWIALLQGVVRVFFPDTFVKIYKDLLHKSGFQIWTWIWMLIGIYLIWIGFSQNG